MEIPRTETELLRLIADRVEESLSLDYKRAQALTDVKGDLKKEVTKDVSAFANSTGGILIYGIAEGIGAEKHLPIAISPIDRTLFSKERLEHLIANIQPRIADIEIIPIQLSSHERHAAFVVDIPASTTAHQCTDKRYYRRYNFEAVAMEDYEVRDVMNRRSLAKIELKAKITFSLQTWTRGFAGMPLLPGEEPTVTPHATLAFSATNVGGVVAERLIAFVDIPPNFLKDDEDGGRYQLRNFQPQLTGEFAIGYPKRGNPQWVPILPSLSVDLEDYELPIGLTPFDVPDFRISWSVHCDDAPARNGVFSKENTGPNVEAEYQRWLDNLRGKQS